MRVIFGIAGTLGAVLFCAVATAQPPDLQLILERGRPCLLYTSDAADE